MQFKEDMGAVQIDYSVRCKNDSFRPVDIEIIDADFDRYNSW